SASCTFHASQRPPAHMSFSDFYASELSDITSPDDDDEFTIAIAKAPTAKKPKLDRRPLYTIVNLLRPPRHRHTHSHIGANRRWINQLRSRLSKRYESCREEIVWSEEKQIGGSQGL
ncbi:hypothetical protein BC827DRAFT_1224942, partial [Russula dissimulans]